MEQDQLQQEPELLPTAPADESPIGTVLKDGNSTWHRVLVQYGKGRWAYWICPNIVCADTLLNDRSAQFAGLLAKPFTSPSQSIEWLLVEPRLHPTLPRPLYIEDIERNEGRYEVNDVDRVK